jgi:hypothetical protein
MSRKKSLPWAKRGQRGPVDAVDAPQAEHAAREHRAGGPAETNASTAPSRSLSIPSTMALPFLWRTAMTGASSLVMISGQSVTVTRLSSSGASANTRSTSFCTVPAGPASSSVRPAKRSSASFAPSTVACGALSPPIASR